LDPPDSPPPDETLSEVVYRQLRAIAEQRMADERAGHTLQATALVHEAYLRVAPRIADLDEGRTRFLRAAAEAMRRILIDHARRRGRQKRGGGRPALPLDVLDLAARPESPEILALEGALRRLEERDPRAAEIVELRFYAGLSIEETAEAMGISPRTVKRDWNLARAWLHRELAADQES
jgi:RNA polymerase sigma factor (TIGR02999 family)